MKGATDAAISTLDPQHFYFSADPGPEFPSITHTHLIQMPNFELRVPIGRLKKIVHDDGTPSVRIVPHLALWVDRRAGNWGGKARAHSLKWALGHIGREG